MIRTILLDCDDVLLNWIAGFRTYASKKLGWEIEGEPTNWDMGCWVGTPSEVATELIREFNDSKAFGQLYAVEGAQEVIAQMHANPDVRLHVITSCSSDAETVQMRRANIEREFGVGTFDSIHCLDLGEPKVKLLRAWAPGALWVEDNYKNALMGVEAGHIVLMRERPHNAEFRCIKDDRVTWFTHWREVGEI